MLARIHGNLESIDKNTAVVVLGEMAYEVMLPAFLAERLAASLGAPLTLHTIQLFEAQAQGASFVPRLLGFASIRDRRFFELFTTVKGIGPKKALRAMALPADEIAGAIARRDVRALQALPEIGKRLAETVIAELSGKVEPYLAPEPGGASAAAAGTGPSIEIRSDVVRQAEDALVRLGEPRPVAQDLIRRAAGAAPGPLTADALLAAAFALRP